MDIAAKFVLLTLSLVYGGRYIGGVVMGHGVSDHQAWLMGLSISGFITLQWLT